MHPGWCMGGILTEKGRGGQKRDPAGDASAAGDNRAKLEGIYPVAIPSECRKDKGPDTPKGMLVNTKIVV